MDYTIAVDIGAGQSTKVALCASPSEVVAEDDLPLREYGTSFEEYTTALTRKITDVMVAVGAKPAGMRGIGVATAGILGSAGEFVLIANVPVLQGHNIKMWLQDHYGVPVGIDNDANAGGLAEWSVLQVELLYWVFGGGWGGAWISRNGRVMFPATDWNGDDATLHPTSEPGYAIPLSKMMLREVFTEVGANYERLEFHLMEEFHGNPGALTGPGGDTESLRAEVILSGPGRRRLFRAVVGDDDFYERFLDMNELDEMADPSRAGKYISKLSSMRVEAAINTDRLYGKILAHATRYMVKRAGSDGLAEGVPICLGGKPSYALPYFGPSTQRFLGKFGLFNYLRPSAVDERGLNANVVGAAVLAEQAAAGFGAPAGFDAVGRLLGRVPSAPRLTVARSESQQIPPPKPPAQAP
ncbi:MAG: ROK family protein [Alkalispirochaeta sp.]